MVATRLEHQTRWSATAVRQCGRQMASSQPISNPDDESFSDFRRRVVQRLESIVPSENGSQESMSGVVRHVRHLGVPLLPTASVSSTRQSNKAALRDIRAKVISLLCFTLQNDTDFLDYRNFMEHVNMHSPCCAMFTPKSCLLMYHRWYHSNLRYLWLPCIHLVAWSLLKVHIPSKKFLRNNMLTLYTVMTIYTNSGAKGANHEWTPSVDHLGSVSYVSLRMFAQLSRAKFTSVVCAELDCSSFVHLPPTHILFSLATFPIQVQPLPFAELTSSILSLDPSTWAIFEAWKSNNNNGEVTAAVARLQARLKSKP